jgi:hypothetical protein
LGNLAVRNAVETFDLSAHIEITLRTKEEAVHRTSHTSLEPNMSTELGFGWARGEVEILGPAFRVESRGDGDRFDESRLPASVLAHQECHLGVELERIEGQ